MGVIGTIGGIANGTTGANFYTTYVSAVANPFLVALVATYFAYMGWDTILSINSEVENSKRNLPIALIAGMLIIMTVYVAYYIGIFSAAPLPELVDGGGVLAAFGGVFGGAAGSALFAFIVVSCLGALNGLVLAGQRSFYTMAVRGRGFAPKLFSQVDPVTNASNNSAIIFVLFVAAWMVVNGGNFAGWYGDFNFDMMGFIPITFQTLLIPVYFWVIFKERDLGVFNRFIAPLFAIGGSAFLVYAIVRNHGGRVLWYLLIFAVIMGIGAVVMLRRPKAE